jgi:hypothetical protein
MSEETKGQADIAKMAKAGFGIGVDAVKTAAVWVLAGFMTASVRRLMKESLPQKPDPPKTIEYTRGDWPK